MNNRVLRFWHQFAPLIQVLGWAGMALMIYTHNVDTQASTLAEHGDSIKKLQKVYEDENMNVRMTRQEQITLDIRTSLTEIKQTEGKIFDRINNLTDH